MSTWVTCYHQAGFWKTFHKIPLQIPQQFFHFYLLQDFKEKVIQETIYN